MRHIVYLINDSASYIRNEGKWHDERPPSLSAHATYWRLKHAGSDSFHATGRYTVRRARGFGKQSFIA